MAIALATTATLGCPPAQTTEAPIETDRAPGIAAADASAPSTAPDTAKSPEIGGALPSATRGTIADVGGGRGRRFRYDYYDLDEPDTSVKELTALGLLGGGPTWAGIVYGLLELRTPATLAVVDFDDEAEGLAVWSDDRKALEMIGHLVALAKSDPEVMKQAIDVAKKKHRIE